MGGHRRERPRQVNEEVAIAHEQVTGVIRGGCEQVPEPQRGRLWRLDAVASAKRRRHLCGISDHHNRCRDRRDSSPEGEKEGKPGVFPSDDARPRPRDSERVVQDIRHTGTQRIEARVLLPSPVEHWRLVPRATKAREQLVVELLDVAVLEVPGWIVRPGRHQTAGGAQGNTE